MAGPLLSGLFKGNFKRMVKEFKKTVQEALDKGKEPNIGTALKHEYITKGVKYSMATGNWGVCCVYVYVYVCEGDVCLCVCVCMCV